MLIWHGWSERSTCIYPLVFAQFYLEHIHSLHCRPGFEKLNTAIGVLPTVCRDTRVLIEPSLLLDHYSWALMSHRYVIVHMRTNTENTNCINFLDILSILYIFYGVSWVYGKYGHMKRKICEHNYI